MRKERTVTGMAEYIAKKQVIEWFMCYAHEDRPIRFEDLEFDIQHMIPEDVAPVRHGRWECIYDDSTGETDITCSYCKNTRTIKGCFVSTDGKSCYFEDDYCPNCGAKMEETDECK